MQPGKHVLDVNEWKPEMQLPPTTTPTSEEGAATETAAERQRRETMELEEVKILYKVEVDSWTRRKEVYRSNVG